MIFNLYNPGIYVLNFTLAAVMLLFTSYLDLKFREVPDKVWLIFGGIGAVLQAYEVLHGETDLVQLGISMGLATAIGMGLYFFGFYGGADGKALIALGLLVPHFTPMVGLYSITPLIILTNGVLISILLPIGLLIYNALLLSRKAPIFEGFEEPTYRKVLACLLGYRQTGKPKDFQFGMEKTVRGAAGGEVKKFDFSLMRDDFETKTNTWVTPGIPLLVFFTAGYFVCLFYGDLVIGLIQSISRLMGF